MTITRTFLECDECGKEGQFAHGIDTEHPPDGWVGYKESYFHMTDHFCCKGCYKKNIKGRKK